MKSLSTRVKLSQTISCMYREMSFWIRKVTFFARIKLSTENPLIISLQFVCLWCVNYEPSNLLLGWKYYVWHKSLSIYNYHLKRLLATDAKHLLFPFQEQNYFSVKLGKANNFTFPGENTGLGRGWQRGGHDPVSRANFNKIHASRTV